MRASSARAIQERNRAAKKIAADKKSVRAEPKTRAKKPRSAHSRRGKKRWAAALCVSAATASMALRARRSSESSLAVLARHRATAAGRSRFSPRGLFAAHRRRHRRYYELLDSSSSRAKASSPSSMSSNDSTVAAAAEASPPNADDRSDDRSDDGEAALLPYWTIHYRSMSFFSPPRTELLNTFADSRFSLTYHSWQRT